MNNKLWLRLAICVVLLAGGVAAFYWFWYVPTVTQDVEQAAQTDEHKRALAELAQSTAGIDDFNRKFKELTEAVRFFESKLPQEKEVETVLEQVWKIAEANSLQTKTIRSGKTDRTANYSQQQIDMELSGDFNGFYLFMQQLEKLPRLTRVEGMTLSKISDHDGAMQAKITLTIFFEPAGSTVTASSM